MATDVLVPHVAMLSSAIALTVWDKQVFTFLQEVVQFPVQYKC